MDRLTKDRPDRYIFLQTFCREEGLVRERVYRWRKRDPEGFPRPCVGKRYLRADLVRYVARYF